MTRLTTPFILLLALLLGTSSALAQATQPAGRPRQRVLVMQFAPLDSASAQHADVGTALQRNLLADLAASKDLEAIPPAAGPQVAAPSDATGAMQEARRVDADVVVFGTYQALDPELRVTGQVLDARHDGQILARLRATGTLRDLFRIEDRLTIQVYGAIGAPLPREIVADQRGTVENEAGAQQPQGTTSPPQTPPYQEPDNYNYSYPPYYGPATYGYDYPYYSSPYYYAPYDYAPYYPYYWYPSVGFFFSNGFHGHGHDDHHDGHHDGHDGFHNGFHNGFHGGFHNGFGNGGFHGGSGFHGNGHGFHGVSGGFHGMGGGVHGGGFGGGGHMGGGGGGGHR